MSTPCKSCPYRKDAPLGFWDASEFENLLMSEDRPMGAVYACHGELKKADAEKKACVGWLLDQKKRNVPSIALRMRLLTNSKLGEEMRSASSEGIKMWSSVPAMCRANLKAIATMKKVRRSQKEKA